MDKNAIFNEFKKNINNTNKEINKEINTTEIDKKDVELVKEHVETVKEDIVKNDQKKKFKKNKNKKNYIKPVEKINYKFEDWKKDFLSKDVNKEFLELIKFYQDKNFNIFSIDEFLKHKFNHPLAKAVILDPTINEINIGKGGNAYIIKPLYMNEYNNFVKTIGPRDENTEAFIQYSIENCVLFPKLTNEQIDKIGAGSILALYKYILEFSDLTKTIRVLEV